MLSFFKEDIDISENPRSIALVANAIGVDNPYYEGTDALPEVRSHRNNSESCVETVKVTRNLYYE